VLVAATGSRARAEERPTGWDGRVFLSVGGGYHPGGDGFSYRDTQTVFQEEASAQARYDPRGGPSLDVGTGVRIGGHFGIGATLSSARGNQQATFDVVVPHPLFFNRPATASSETRATRNETALHLQAIFLMPLGKGLRLGVFGGPTRFWRHQELVYDAELEPTLLSDQSFTLSVPKLRTLNVDTSGWGFHAGTELTVRMAKHLGFSGVFRYSHATGHLENPLTRTRTGAGDAVSIDLGGFSATGSLKLWF
jgi:hypothetical protein